MMKKPAQKRIDYLGIFLLLIALAATGVHYLLHIKFTVDDAAISFSYARNFAQGLGLGALYPGALRVEGYSNLLWVILLGAGTRLGLDTILVSKIFGLLFAMGCVVLLYFILREHLHRNWFLLGLILLPASLTFTFWSVSGLENSFYTFVILLSVFFLIREEHKTSRIPFGSAVILILIGITRPEGLLYAFAALAYKVIQTVISRSSNDQAANHQKIKSLLIWIAIFVIGYGVFKIWHLWYFAYLWPNPIYAKATWNSSTLIDSLLQPEGWGYLRGYFRTYGATYLIPFLMLGGLLVLRNELRVLTIYALTALALPIITFDWMINYRFIFPFIPFQVAFIIIAADQLWDWAFRKSNTPVWLRAGALVLGILFAFTLARSSWANIRLSQQQLACGYEKPWAEARCIDGRNYWTMGEVGSMYADLKSYAHQVDIQDPLYLIPDIGATSYVHNYRILDLAGLADIHLARSEGTQTIRQYILQEQLPDFIRTHSIWTRRSDITALSLLWETYIPIKYRKDKQGHIHGTFIRKDLIVKDQTSAEVATELAPGLFLSETYLPDAIRPNQSYPIKLTWYIKEPQTEDLNQRVKLFDQDGEMIFTQTAPLGYGWYPISDWQPQESIQQTFRLPEDLSEGEYTIEIKVVTDKDEPVDQKSFIQRLIINEKSAEIYAQKLLTTANEFATQEDYINAYQLAKQAELIYPGSTANNEKIEEYRIASALQFLAQAQDFWNRNDLPALITSSRQAAKLRGRHTPLPQWKTFGDQLYTAASKAQANKDWERSYALYLAASFSNPDNAWAARNLEIVRGLYLNSLQ